MSKTKKTTAKCWFRSFQGVKNQENHSKMLVSELSGCQKSNETLGKPTFVHQQSIKTYILLCFFNFFVAFDNKTYILLCFFNFFVGFCSPNLHFTVVFQLFNTPGRSSGVGPEESETGWVAGSARRPPRSIKKLKKHSKM